MNFVIFKVPLSGTTILGSSILKTKGFKNQLNWLVSRLTQP